MDKEGQILLTGIGNFVSAGIHDLRVGHAQVLVRIDWNVVNPHFVVKMRSGRATRLAYVSNNLASRYVFAS